MKYIKTYSILEGTKSKWEEERKIREKLKKFVPGSFSIILYQRWTKEIKDYSKVLALVKIINTETTSEYVSHGNYEINYYIKIQILDYISEYQQDDLEINSHSFISVNSTPEYLFNSNSRKETEQKFEELKQEYEPIWSSKKYNL